MLLLNYILIFVFSLSPISFCIISLYHICEYFTNLINDIITYEYYFQSEIETRLESYRGNQGSALLLASHNKLRHELSGKLSELQRVKRDLEVARNQVEILRSNNATASGEDVHPPPPLQPLSAPPSPQSRQLERGAVAIQERRLHELEASERRCDVHAKGE